MTPGATLAETVATIGSHARGAAGGLTDATHAHVTCMPEGQTFSCSHDNNNHNNHMKGGRLKKRSRGFGALALMGLFASDGVSSVCTARKSTTELFADQLGLHIGMNPPAKY